MSPAFPVGYEGADHPLAVFPPNNATLPMSDEDVERWISGPHAVRAQRLAAAGGEATPEQVTARIDYYGGLCWICREAKWEVIDHVKPIARGGSGWAANLRPACRSCNARKGKTWPL